MKDLTSENVKSKKRKSNSTSSKEQMELEIIKKQKDNALEADSDHEGGRKGFEEMSKEETSRSRFSMKNNPQVLLNNQVNCIWTKFELSYMGHGAYVIKGSGEFEKDI